jgi:ABC-type transport system involved in multi-copper enzyme maturation permease subunit
MPQALVNLRQYTSHVLLSLEVLLFLAGVMTLLMGRIIVAPRRYVDGIAGRAMGVILLMPLILAFAVLFGLALSAHLSYAQFPFQSHRFAIELGQAVNIVVALAIAGLIAVRYLRVEQLQRQSPLRWEKLHEQGPLVLFIFGVALALYFSWGRSFWKQLLIWAPLVPAFGYLLRRGSVKLFGPVLFYDLVRSGRRGRFVLVRFFYCSVLFISLMWVFFIFTVDRRHNDRMNDVTYMARMADSFFYTFVTLQLLVVVVLTPAYTAGAIADEKDRHTLEYLLATDLRNREIVLSKLVSRMANLSLMLLAGLPILSLMQFLGGVDPGLVLAGFAATALTMASLAALSILMSVYAKKPRDAIALTYLTALAYITIPWIVGEILKFTAGWFVGIPLAMGDALNTGVTVGDAIDWLNSGNLVKSYFALAANVGRGRALATELEDYLISYAIFHGLAITFFSFWAVARLRAVALKQTFGKTARLPLFARVFGRPRVGAAPMLWKEIFVEAGPGFGWMGRIVIGVLVILSFVPAIWIVGWAISEYFDPTNTPWNRSLWERVRTAVNVWVRVAATGVACLSLLGVAVRAAGSVSGERDKQTLDALLTSPLDSDNILFSKWVGSILSVRWSWLWLVMMWMTGVALGGIQFFAPVLLLGAWFVLAGFVAMVGLWYSTACKTTLRATVWTLGTVTFLGGGHWLLGAMCCYWPLAAMNVRERDFEYLLFFQMFGLTPPFTLGFLAIHGEEFEHWHSRENPWIWLSFCLIGLFIWGVAAAILWAPTSERFRRQTGRQRLKRPEQRPFRLAPESEPAGAWPKPFDDDVPIILSDAIVEEATNGMPSVLPAEEPPDAPSREPAPKVE